MKKLFLAWLIVISTYQSDASNWIVEIQNRSPYPVELSSDVSWASNTVVTPGGKQRYGKNMIPIAANITVKMEHMPIGWEKRWVPGPLGPLAFPGMLAGHHEHIGEGFMITILSPEKTSTKVWESEHNSNRYLVKGLFKTWEGANGQPVTGIDKPIRLISVTDNGVYSLIIEQDGTITVQPYVKK
jgi:hypothetical protein